MSVTAGAETRAALEVFPPVMEMKLDLPALMDMEVFTSRLADLDRRLSLVEEGLADPMMSFLACYLHHNAGQDAEAKRFARMVQNTPDESKTAKAYAEYVLTGKLPEAATQPVVAPASQPTTTSAKMGDSSPK